MFPTLSGDDLRALAKALDDRRLIAPFGELSLGRLGLPKALAAELAYLAQLQFTPVQMARLAEALATERECLEDQFGKVEIVATGPDPQERSRSTAVVVEQLFREAKQRVLIVGFAVYGGQEIFKTIAERMDHEPALVVTCCFDISRKSADTTRASDLINRFATNFVHKQWPGARMPRVYYDPRGLDSDPTKRAVLHAKTVVIDGRKALITSANPTEAAYLRNIELGILIDDPGLAAGIERLFDSLINEQFLAPVCFNA